jgi:hypothetical protein
MRFEPHRRRHPELEAPDLDSVLFSSSSVSVTCFLSSISDSQNLGGVAQVGAYFRPQLNPPVKRAPKEEERVPFHLLVFQPQVGFDYGRTIPHPIFVALGHLQNIHNSYVH